MTAEKQDYCYCLISGKRVKSRIALLNKKTVWVYVWNEKIGKEIIIKRHNQRHKVELI